MTSSFAAIFAGQAILSATTATARLGDPGVLRAVLGAGLYLTTIGLGSLALGTLLRRATGAIATVVGLVFVLPGLVGALASSWQNVTKYLPSSASDHRPHEIRLTIQPHAPLALDRLRLILRVRRRHLRRCRRHTPSP
jgi:hypothetical protein